MSRTIIISDDLYARLSRAASQSGYSSIEMLLLTTFPASDNAPASMAEIDTLRNKMAAKYGGFSDSTPLIREDRDRH